ncbi:MAG: DUF192 domain-containing protein [Opitutaceae bacterium]
MKNANPVSLLFRVLVLMCAVLMTTGCGRSDSPTDIVEPKTVADFFVVTVGDKPVKMQLAVKQREMERGLMDRRDLKSDEGMLFVYDEGRPQSFWMRNTPTALDIGFFTSDGVLREVYQMYPFDETPVKSRSNALQFALEMNQGWFEFYGVRPGAKLDLKALAAALKARGFDSAVFGLK